MNIGDTVHFQVYYGKAMYGIITSFVGNDYLYVENTVPWLIKRRDVLEVLKSHRKK